MKRGELVTIALQGEHGKPRPALVVQSDLFEAHATVTVLPLTSEIIEPAEFRVLIQPSSRNGLEKPSQVMADKIQTAARRRIGRSFGTVDEADMLAVNRALALFLGLV